jgi:hypothetical protein
MPPFPAGRLKLRNLDPSAEAKLAFGNLDFFLLALGVLAAGPVVRCDLCAMLAI